MTNPNTPSSTPICPRCAYDLSAPIPTWTDACPLQGKCPECGLDFAWSRVIHADRYLLPWLIEHASLRPLTATRAFFITARRSLNPITFWRRLDMSHPIRWRRLLLHVALCYILMHTALVATRFSIAIGHTIPAWLAQRRVASAILTAPPPAPPDVGVWASTPTFTGWTPGWAYAMSDPPDWVPTFTPGTLTYAYSCPIPDGVTTMRIAGRLDFTPLTPETAPTNGQWTVFYLGAPQTGPTAIPLWTFIRYEAGLTPRQAIAITLFPYWFDDDFGPVGSGVLFAFTLLAPLTAAIVLPFTFITVATTLGNAGVRAAHFVRATAYSVAALFVLQAASTIPMAIYITVQRTADPTSFPWSLSEDIEDHWFTWHLIAGAAWLLLNWWMFCKRYLRIPHAFWVTLLLSIIAYLIVPAAAMVLGYLLNAATY